MNRLDTAVSRDIQLGETTIYWLSAATQIAEHDLEKGLHADECLEAQAMRSLSRREEFRRTRYLIRKLTGQAAPLGRFEHGAPRWPNGLIGSITHKHGSIGVALENATALYGLGIDAEDTNINLKLEPRILHPQESRLLDATANRAETLAATFAFKEAIFKACFPQGGIMFYFHDAEILAIDAGKMTARLLRNVGPGTPSSMKLHGHYMLLDDMMSHGEPTRLVLCAVRISLA